MSTILPLVCAFGTPAPRPRFHRRCAHVQQGQALTEFLVVALALVPLFLLMPLIGKYQDIAHSTQMAARYTAFAATVRNDAMGRFVPEAQLADEVRRRFFSNTQAPIKTHDAAGDVDDHRNPFWRRPDGKALIPSLSAVALGFGRHQGSAHADGFAAASDGDAFPLRGPLSLESRGIYTTHVRVALADMPAGLRAYEPFDRLGLAMVRSTSLLIDPWTGRGPAEVQAKLSDPLVFPGGVLRGASPAIEPIVEAVELPGGLKAPRLGRLDFWQDVVPPDRLGSQP